MRLVNDIYEAWLSMVSSKMISPLLRSYSLAIGLTSWLFENRAFTVESNYGHIPRSFLFHEHPV
jgi:hypothetical protein